jgi:lysozyme
MTKKCVELVKKYEGFRAVPYLCPAGYPTVGYGHVITKGEILQYPMSKEFAEQLLLQDLIKTEMLIRPMIKVDIHPYMLDALVSFSFNVGAYAFKSSTLRKKLNSGEWYECAEQFLRWIYAGGKKLTGLIKRRQEERELFLEGVNLYG